MRAAAQGNTSPAAMAAIEEQLGREGAIQAGNAASTASLAASAEKARRAQNIEGMRLGSEQDISGRRTANAGNLYGARSGSDGNIYNARAGQAQNLAALEQGGIEHVAGTRLGGTSQAANLGYTAADTGGRAMYGAADTGGAAGMRAAEYGGNLGYEAADTGGRAAMTSGKYSADRNLGTEQGNQETGQGLAIGADNASVARNTGIANQRIAGNDKYRGYLTNEQGLAQQGGETATNQQIGNFGTQAGAMNTATSTGAQAAAQKDAQPGMFSKIIGGISGAAKAASTVMALADGGVVTEPTVVMIGERGPERVIPLQKERSRFGRYGMPLAA